MIYINLKIKNLCHPEITQNFNIFGSKINSWCQIPSKLHFLKSNFDTMITGPSGIKTWICSYLIQYLPNQPWKKILMSWQHILSLKKVLLMNSNNYPSYRKKTDFAFSLTGWQKKMRPYIGIFRWYYWEDM